MVALETLMYVPAGQLTVPVSVWQNRSVVGVSCRSAAGIKANSLAVSAGAKAAKLSS
jgi:hypothetical protein